MPENKKSVKIVDLLFGYKWESHEYFRTARESNLCSSENFLIDANGDKVFQYRNIDNVAEIAVIIEHSNGKRYFLFRIDLYGYGVLDLQTLECFVYIPKEIETFIWTNLDYNPANNILVVGGCYWAAPYGTLLLDFSEPMKETKWADIHAQIDNVYYTYDDIDFVRWDEDVLILCAYSDNGKIELSIQKAQYKNWLKL